MAKKTEWDSIVDKLVGDVAGYKAHEMCDLQFVDAVEDAGARLRSLFKAIDDVMAEMPGIGRTPQPVVIKLRPDQAEAFAAWIGEMRVATLPLEICQAIYVISLSLKRGASCDVTAVETRNPLGVTS